MSAERSGKSHTVAWTLATAVAIPAFYVLSVPPLWEATLTPPYFVPEWVTAYNRPYLWLEGKTPLCPLLEGYAAFWKEMVRGPG
jgi:hypothetical protein